MSRMAIGTDLAADDAHAIMMAFARANAREVPSP